MCFCFISTGAFNFTVTSCSCFPSFPPILLSFYPPHFASHCTQMLYLHTYKCLFHFLMPSFVEKCNVSTLTSTGPAFGYDEIVLQDGWHPIYVASSNGHLEVVKFLIEARAIVNHRNKVSAHTHISAFFIMSEQKSNMAY